MKLPIIRLLRHWQHWARLAVRSVASAAIIAAASNALAEAIHDSALQQISALQAEKASRTPAQLKMDSQLIYALKQSLNQAIAPGVTNLRVFVQAEADGRVKVDLKATVTQDLLSFIQNLGGSILSSVPGFQAVRALVPLSLTETLAGRADVQFVQAAVAHGTRTGSVDSEGDTTHRAAEARQDFGATGLGVKVGVLSDSVDYLSQAVSTGDLPPNVTVLPGQSGVPGTGEGTAMLEIVYDLAPGAQLFYATGDGGPANFAQNILNLRAAGCDIIVDDIFYFNESPFQDAIIAQAVNSVTADGALYFSAAGNEGNLTHGTSGTWEGDFLDGGAAGPPVNGKGGTLHSFGTNAYDNVTGVGFATILDWSDPLGASTNDYDLYVLDATGVTVVSASTTVQNGGQDPYEIVAPPNVGERVVVVLATGTNRFLHLDTIRGQLSVNTAGNITGHPTARNAFACSAVDVHTAYPNPFSGGAANPVESFSSDGPRRVFYNVNGTPITPGDFSSTGGFVRQKPDITAADGVATTLPPFSGLNPFYGTSAAAPHAAAIAALLKSFNPTLTPSQVRAILTSSALDNEAPGYDFNAGYGIVMAYQALQAAPPLRVPVLVLVTNILSGGNNNGVIDFNECNNLSSILTNIGRATATGVRATLSTKTPGVIVAVSSSTYPDILPGGAAAVGRTPFRISTSPAFVCGTPIDFTLVVKCDQAAFTNQFRFFTGLPGTPLRFDNSTPTLIPDLGVANSIVVVSNVTAGLSKVTAALYITHTYDSDLLIQLISPDGTTNTLSDSNGSFGHDYGSGCGQDSQRTIFDDDALLPISSGAAPFVGVFKPQTPLSVFIGKAGTNINGIWRLRVVDQARQDVGTIQCWSLILTPADCKDGGGECPGADLALGMTAQPTPVVIGSYLTYTITVTNRGPSSAKNVAVTHQLPSSVIFVSAVASQGTCSQSGGVVSGSLGTLTPGAGAIVTVVGIPSVAGNISSTATVGSSEPDPDPSNNSATVISQVNPASADLVAGIIATPNPIVLGGTLTYTVTVTNRGPSDSSGVTVANALPASVAVLSATISQGSISPGGALWTVGTLPYGAGATATITVVPTQEGVITATATAQGNQLDPAPANNTAIVATVVGAAADLAISITDFPDPTVVSSNLTYMVTVVNQGPSAATGVGVNDFLPVGVALLAPNATQGVFSLAGNTLSWTVGNLASGAKATLTVVLSTTKSGVLNTSATVAGAQNDPNLANNSATASTVVATPFTSVAAAGATLTAESGPINGAVDPGETVTVVLRLRADGNVSTRNLVATLLATNGVVPIAPNNPQTYGILFPSGFSVGRPFSFTANGIGGGTVNAVLQLQDGTNTYPPVSFAFALPSTFAFATNNVIVVPDPAAQNLGYPLQSGPARPYPSTISVSNLVGTLGKVAVTLSNLNHSYPGDVNVLLVAPGVANVLIMSHAGDQDDSKAGLNLTFDDSAANPLPESGELASGVWKPSVYGLAPQLGGFPSNAPAGPYSTALSTFNGVNPNGNWSLYVFDDSGGDSGAISNGWSLQLSMITPVNQLADLRLAGVAGPNPCMAGDILTYTYTVTNGGPNAAAAVAFTNTLPAGVALVAATSSQGSVITSAASVIVSLGTLNSGSGATVVVSVVPTAGAFAPGSNTATLTSATVVAATETDINPANNSVSISTTVTRPVADVGLSLTVAPDQVYLGWNLTNTVTITNNGPGKALAVTLTEPLPAGAGLSTNSSSSTGGAFTVSNGIVICAVGDLASNASATVSIVLTNTILGPMTNMLTVATGSQDLVPINNSTKYVATVIPQAPKIINAGALLTYESGPINGVIDPGETVTLSLSLANVGAKNSSTNLTATLQLSGVVATNQINTAVLTNSYGQLIYGGPSTSRSFSFKAATVLGGANVATLILQDESAGLTNQAVPFTFLSPVATNFSNQAAITIPDHGVGSLYPSTINVAGLAGEVTKATVILNGLTHTFPRDVNVLLVSPSGSSVLLMSHTGGGNAVTNPITLTFDDAAPSSLSTGGPLTTGTFKPTSYPGTVAFPAPAPSSSYGSALKAVNGQSPNGAWSLYVLDDASGDGGLIAGGWSLSLAYVVAVNPYADLALGLSSTPASLFPGGTVTSTILVTNLGAATASSVVVTETLSSGGQVSTNIGSLAVGAGAKVTLVMTLTVPGTIISTATVAGNEVDPNQGNNSANSITTVASPLQAALRGSSTNGVFQLTVKAQPNFTYVIEGSTNLASWLPLDTNTASPEGTIIFTDTNGSSISERYYRTRQVVP